MTTLVNEVPENGLNDQVLKKNGSGFDQYGWETILEVPSGGSIGQVLTRTASGYAWQTPTGGGLTYYGRVSTVVTGQAQYTVPSNRLFQGQLSSTSFGSWVYKIDNSSSDNPMQGSTANDASNGPLFLGGPSFIRNTAFSTFRVSGFLLGN